MKYNQIAKREDGRWEMGESTRSYPPSSILLPILSILLIFEFSIPAHAADKYSLSQDVPKSAVKELVEEKAVETVKEQKTVAKPETKAVSAASTSAAELEAAVKFKGIQKQEQWIVKLEAQLAAEKGQLSEMRGALASAFGLDVKKLEKGGYSFDTKSGKFVDK